MFKNFFNFEFLSKYDSNVTRRKNKVTGQVCIEQRGLTSNVESINLDSNLTEGIYTVNKAKIENAFFCNLCFKSFKYCGQTLTNNQAKCLFNPF